MRHHQRPLVLLITAIISFLALCCFVYFVSPTKEITLPGSLTDLPFSFDRFLHIPPISIFFVLIALFLFSAGSYLLKSKAHGILIAGFVVIYLLFRLNHLTHPFFLILLLALFFVLELLVSSKNNAKSKN